MKFLINKRMDYRSQKFSIKLVNMIETLHLALYKYSHTRLETLFWNKIIGEFYDAFYEQRESEFAKETLVLKNKRIYEKQMMMIKNCFNS